MPRQPRFILLGQPQHIIVRGNNKSSVFIKHKDYLFFLESLLEAIERFDCEVHAYVLMTNHVHLLITPKSETGISKSMQSVGRRYVQYFNKKYSRTGTLWEGRFKACLIDSEQYALTCYRYIELNPVRAHLVNHPKDYRWSSYRRNANGEDDPLLTSHELYRRLGTNASERCQSYCDLFSGHIEQETLDTIRYATNKCWALGGDQFEASVESENSRPLKPQKRGGDRRSKVFKGV